jgi:glycosyltransferase involved in cell wall biosynthesis
MKIVSVTIAHNRESTIAGALACVEPFVDECLLLDTGITDRTLVVASDAVGAKLRVVAEPWENDFSRARNRVLDFAAECGADWAIMIDTDQRIDWNSEVSPAWFLEQTSSASMPPPACFLMRSKDGRFSKEQIFSIPRRHAYKGRTHECYPFVGAPEFPNARVWGVPKSAAELAAKHERDCLILQDEVKANPHYARGWFYLGEALSALKHHEESIHAHARCFIESERPDEAGWSAYRNARTLTFLEKHHEVLTWCRLGLQRCPAMAELALTAAWVCHLQCDYPEALVWSERAIRLGAAGRRTSTSGFRDLPAYYEGPYGLAALSAGMLGKTEESRAFEMERLNLKRARENKYGEAPGPIPPQVG